MQPLQEGTLTSCLIAPQYQRQVVLLMASSAIEPDLPENFIPRNRMSPRLQELTLGISAEREICTHAKQVA